MEEVNFKEVKTVEYVVKKVSFDELYELFKEKAPGFDLTPRDLLIQIAKRLIQAPTMEMRFHFIEEDGEAIMAVIPSVKIAEKLKENEKIHGK